MRTFIESLLNINPILLALLATLFTWFMTALGSALVFFVKTMHEKAMNAMLGFAAGVMIAASFWSLLQPAIEMGEGKSMGWLPVFLGFLGGGAFLYIIDKILPHLHSNFITGESTEEGIHTSWKRSVLLALAVTLHNIPEGLAVGVAFGALSNTGDPAMIGGAISLAIGMGIQNFPEGAIVSIPLAREGVSKWKAFNMGQLSGAVEPIAAVFGAWMVMSMTPIMPYALAFAAGAMIYVVVEELIPTSQNGKHSDYATIGAMIGFAIMMLLDTALTF